MLRDKQKEQAYFEYAIQDKQEDLERLQGYLDQGKGVPLRLHSRLYSAYLSSLLLQYSMGKDLDDLKSLLPRIIHHFLETLRLERESDEVEKFTDYIGLYEEALQILCLGILLQIDRPILTEFKAQCDATRGQDLLIASLWAAYTREAIPAPTSAIKILYPKSYLTPYQVLQSGKEQGEKQLLDYCSTWLKSKKKASWYGSLKSSEVGGACDYYGYWNLEGAALAFLLGVEASKFEEMAYFPLEMLEYAQKKG